MPKLRDPIAQFWEKVDRRSDEECWPMKANRVRLPYGKAHLAGHKFSALLHFGPYDRRLAVRQNCGMANCVNPAHLSIVSRSEITGNSREQLWEKMQSMVAVDEATGCWNWTGKLNANGYAVSPNAGRRFFGTTLGHRVSFLLNGGDLSGGLLACHKCDNRKCINPDHIFAGTHFDNMQDMHAKGRANPPFRDVTHCVNGHPFDEVNTGYRKRGRYCIACHKESSHRNYLRKKASYGHVA